MKVQGGQMVPMKVPALENARQILVRLPKELKETTLPGDFILKPMTVAEQPGYMESRVGIRMERFFLTRGRRESNGIIFKDVMPNETYQQFMKRHYLVQA